MNRYFKQVLINAVVITLALGLAQTAVATDYYWDIDGPTAVANTTPTGTWDGTNNFWNTNSTGGAGTFIANPGSSDTITLSANSTNQTYTVSMTGTRSVAKLTIEDGGTTGSGGVTISGGTSLTIGSSGISAPNNIGNMTISTPIILGASQTWDQANTFNGLSPASISDGGNGYTLTKSGGGRLNFLGNNYSYTGGTTISAGQLRLNTTDTVSTANGANNIVTVNVNGGLLFGGNGVTAYTISTIAGSGNITLQDTLNNNNNVALTLGTTTGNYANTTYSGVMSGNGSLVKRNVNALTLSGNNTFTGGTTINSGTVLIGVSDTSGTVGALGGSSRAVFLGDTTGTNSASLLMGGAYSLGNTVTVRSDSSTGPLTIGGDTADTSTFSGAINLGSAAAVPSKNVTLVALAGGTAIFSGVLNEGSGNTTVANVTIGDATHSGTVRLSNTGNAYGGNTTITNGATLEVTEVDAGGNNSSIGNNGTAAGNIVIDGGTLRYIGGGVATTNRLFTVGANGATLDANAAVSFTGVGSLAASGSGDRTLTLTGASNGSLTSVIVNPGTGSTALAKSGNGVWILGGANTYTGSTSVAGGTLQLGASNRVANASDLVLAGGTFATGGFSDVMDTLDLDASSILDFGTAASVLQFTNSSGLSWAGTLTVDNWSGLLAGGGTDQWYVGTNTSGLTPTQLSQIQFTGYNPGAMILSTGEVVPVPEPSSLAMMLFAGLAMSMFVRKRQAI